MKNNENIMDWKEVKRRRNGNGRIPTETHQKKATIIVGHINKADGLEKQKLSGHDRRCLR